jgi:hypothetical protein
VLFFAGLVALLLFAVWAFVAAIVAHLALGLVEARTDWNISEKTGCIVPFMLAFLISGAAAFALDLIFTTYVSLPAMIDAVDRLTVFEHARREPLIQSVRDYYAFVLGSTPGTWLRFAGPYVVIVLVFAAVLLWLTLNIESVPDAHSEPMAPMKRNLQLLGISTVAVGAVALTLFPLTTWAMLALRNLRQ